jgi:hypothetical protein
MPVVSVSLSDIGYEGYKELPKGRRSRLIDRMLRDYALDHHHTVVNNQRRSIREVSEAQVLLEQRIASYQEKELNTDAIIKILKQDLKEARQ